MRFDDFIGPTYRPSSYAVDVERSVNWYTERTERKDGFSLLRTPGRRLFSNLGLGNGTVWGQYSLNNHLFAVSGTKVAEIFSNGAKNVFAGSVNQDGKPARMTGNPDQLFIVIGGKGYIVENNALHQITSPDFPPNAVGAAFIDGYFITGIGGTQRFGISDLNNGNLWDSVRRSDAEANPDIVNMLGNISNELYPFGSQTVQIFTDTGDFDFPFEPRQDITIELGIWAPHSLTNVAGAWYMIGGSSRGNNIVYRMNGYTPSRVSDHSIENAMRKMATTEDAVGWTYEENGHAFYGLYFPTADQTWVYDVSVDQWHERTWFNNGVEHAHRTYSAAQCFGKILVGDRIDGNIYEMSMDYLDDAGDYIQRTRITPCIKDELRGIVHSNFVLDGNMGIGLDGLTDVDDPRYDPKMMLQWSDNGGKTFGNEHWRGFGRISEFGRRAIWRDLGYARRRVYKAVVTAPVDWGFAGCYVNLKGAR